MVSRADVDALARGGSSAAILAKRDLDKFWSAFSGRAPEVFRDALLDFVPDLVRQYGDIASTVAAEWYEDNRARAVGGSYNALTSPGVAVEQVQGGVRYAAGHLFTDDPTQGLALLSGALQRYVLYSTRDTVARNVQRDPRRPRFGRIPSGAKTCAFCTLMASRGFVYLNRETAGLHKDYHDDCDCQIVAEWDRDQHHIAGYDPDRMYDLYQQAAAATRSSDPKVILAEMRRMHPDEFTDGVVADH
jgi:hypothetical protein